MAKNYYIAISRQSGCGGRLVGKALADRLGIAYYDRDNIIDLVAEDCGLARQSVVELMERKTSSLLYEMATFAHTNPLEEQVFLSKNRVIENLLKVFLYGSTEQRIDRIVNVYQDVPGLTAQKLKAMDKTRADYYRFFTSYKWGDWTNYDILFNTDLGLDPVTDMLEHIAKVRFGGEA